ncbi:hypothetical protein vBEcoMWL3_gp114 [Escherichia phage vB_EcoM_WL-3]|nr:hypothetical protein vBEcoMWL3_gp114 [Escherichia phage vB_EcoM_WL-3]
MHRDSLTNFIISLNSYISSLSWCSFLIFLH